MSIVPDSITPVEGWKMWDLRGDELISPNYGLVWPAGEPAQAECMVAPHYRARWTVSDEKPLPPTPLIATTGPTGPTAMIAFSAPQIPQAPRTILPPGKYWRLETVEEKHDAPVHGCSCGIYIANDLLIASGYGRILGKVQGWGNVVEHQSGWRAQYAYPKELYATSVEEALKLSNYGVPVTLVEDCDDDAIKDVYTSFVEPDGFPLSMLGDRSFARAANTFAPFFLAGLTIVDGIILYQIPSIIGGVSLACCACATGFTAGLRVKM